MKTFHQIYALLRRKNKKNYLLLVLCNFFSVLLITAYVAMMRSPTVLTILPEGGDSRKQVMMIFVLAVAGCGIFTTYASSLFFRFKSREVGILMALGASKRQIRRELFQELLIIAAGTCFLGILLGTPLAWVIWQGFRLLIVNTKEMGLSFDPQAYLFAGAFSLFTLISLFFMGIRFIRRTNIMDIVNQQRKNEPMHDVKPWFGPLGILLIILGGFLGYMTPSVCVRYLHWYSPGWLTGVMYLPLFPGLYMVLIHTVVRGWRNHGKNRYEHMITHSMMKFQGRQTVRNMAVITVLLAGAYFAMFYTPMLGTANMWETKQRTVDYAFHYRSDQNMLTRRDIDKTAKEEGITITEWKEAEFANLGSDGREYVDDEGGKFHYEYRKLIGEGNFIAESDYNRLNDENVDILPGMFGAVLASDGSGDSGISTEITRLTNMTSRITLPVSFQEYVYSDMMATDYYVLDDNDYALITKDLSAEWREKLICFNVEEVMDTYDFASRLYNEIINHSGSECEIPEYYDRVKKIADNEAGKIYWGDTDKMTHISYKMRDSSEFKRFWKYAPKFRVLDSKDFMENMAVFLMLFIFIAIICFAAVLVIGYTRCMTIAINNRQVFEDLKRLGASPHYLYVTVRGQITKVFGVPGVVGTTMIYVLYAMIMYFNDNKLTQSETAGLMNCLLLVTAMSILLWGFYRFTLKRVLSMLAVRAKNKG